MGKNRFENFVFSLTMCFFMVLGMTTYNNALMTKDPIATLASLASVQVAMVFLVAFIIDWFAVAPVVKSVVSRFTTDKTPMIIKILSISSLMVLLMCTAMSFLATIALGYEGSFLLAFANVFFMNLVFALPLQFLFAGPIARFLFFKMFPKPQPALNAA